MKDFLQAENLDPLIPGFFNQRDVFLNHGLFYFSGSPVVFGIGGLDVGAFYNSGHNSSLEYSFVAIA
jgi:hypothetical protein